MARKSYQETLAELQARRTKILKKEYNNEANRQRALTKVDTEIRHADPNQCTRYVIDFKIKSSELKNVLASSMVTRPTAKSSSE